MKNKYKYFLTPLVLSLLALVSGCNSEDAFNGNDGQPTPTPDSTLVEITVTPSPISALWRIPNQLKAIATYDDGSLVDISKTADWAIITDPVNFADLTPTGLLTPKVTGVDKIVASKDGIFSEDITVTVDDLSGPVIDIFDTGTGKLFTNSPSKAYLDSIGGSATTTEFEIGTHGPIGDFYKFNWDSANTLCDKYTEQSLAGRTNWRLAEKDELVALLHMHGIMFNLRGWPTTSYYWSATSNNSTKFNVSLYYDHVIDIAPSYADYASCVSNP